MRVIESAIWEASRTYNGCDWPALADQLVPMAKVKQSQMSTVHQFSSPTYAMSASALICRPSQLLGKRRADDVFVPPSPSICSHSSVCSEPHQSHASSSKTNAPIIINGKLQPGSKKRYQCTYNGCNKAYSKPSRLVEHERSHTGEVSTGFE